MTVAQYLEKNAVPCVFCDFKDDYGNMVKMTNDDSSEAMAHSYCIPEFNINNEHGK